MAPYTPVHPEMWNTIPRLPNYAISTWGRVLNVVTNQFLNGYSFSPDYPVKMNLKDLNGDTRTCMVHRLVAEAFYTGFEPDARIYFVNGNKYDCHILNLRFVRRGVGQFIPGTETVRVRQIVTSYGEAYNTVRDAAKDLGVGPSEVYDVLLGRRPRVAGRTVEWQWEEFLPDGYQPIPRADKSAWHAPIGASPRW